MNTIGSTRTKPPATRCMTKERQATQALRQLIRPGRKPLEQRLVLRAMRRAGFTDSTTQRARRNLSVISERPPVTWRRAARKVAPAKRTYPGGDA